ncbi:MAG: ubiquinol-cytochrome c reductase iron-sulfur subunit [Chloroflexi bacterium]|nr:ubiquinol-cytochrome c reductase iron-sulfur subunit [Chloroflexota bacterium]
MSDNPKQGLFYSAERASAAAAVPGQSIGVEVGEKGPPRRLVLRWVGWGAILLTLGQWTMGFLGFFTPGRTGAFGSVVTVPKAAADFKVGDVFQVIEGKFYVTRVPEGFFALWWKCPHLGCTVPWKENDPVMEGDTGFADKGRFNCPCHGSIYNRYGQILQGPAPRPMDRFALTIDGGKIKVDTKTPITRGRANPADAVPA